MFALEPLSREAIPVALEEAERYRFLNEPAEAESICVDVLRTDPENQRALVLLLVPLTDRLGKGYAGIVAAERLREALACFEKAAELRPPGNDDAILRWNTCARILLQNQLPESVPEEVGEMGLE